MGQPGQQGLREKIEVEALSEARWAQIEKSVFAELDRDAKDPLLQPMTEVRPRRGFGFVHGVVVASVVAAAAVVLLAVFGARYLGRDGAPAPLGANPSRIVTGASESHLAFGESSIDVAPESTALVTGDDEHGVLVVIDRGAATFEIAPRRGRPPVVVQAGEVRVRVIGTRFTVARDGDDARVSVEHGTVEVLAHGKTSLVHGGEAWPAATQASAVPPLPALAPTATVVVPPHAQQAQPAPGPLGAETPVPRLAASPLHPSPLATALHDSVARAPAADAPDHASSPDSQSTAMATPPAPQPAEATPPSPSPRELYEQALAAERGDPGRAVAIYQKLSATGGAWGMNALYSWAMLEYHRGNYGQARALLTQYLARFSGGPNAADARKILEQLH